MTVRNATKRKYQDLWNSLKINKRVSIIPSTSESPEIVKKWANTIRKAVQKEKYMDTKFRIAYPNSKLDSTFNADEKKLTITLDLGIVLDSVDALID